VDVDEATDLPAVVHEPLAQSGELRLQVLDEVGDGVAPGLDLGAALGDRAERGGNADQHRHQRPSWACDLRLASASSNAASVGRIVVRMPTRPCSGSGVLRPFPVTQITTDSSRPMTPRSTSFLVAATVTPPAVSAKMPSVRARSSMASTISASEASAAEPPDSFAAR